MSVFVWGDAGGLGERWCGVSFCGRSGVTVAWVRGLGVRFGVCFGVAYSIVSGGWLVGVWFFSWLLILGDGGFGGGIVNACVGVGFGRRLSCLGVVFLCEIVCCGVVLLCM